MSRYEPYVPCSQRRDPLHARIREATANDAEAIAQIEAEREGDHARDRVSKVREHIERASYPVWVAEVDGVVAGFARIAWVDGASQAARGPARGVVTGYYLMGIIIAAAFRRRGLGRALTRVRLGWIVEQGATAAYYLATPQNVASIALHREFGFEELTRDIVYPGIPQRGPERALYRAFLGGRS